MDIKKIESSSSDDEVAGVLSKKDRQVFQEYKDRAKDVDRKKYQS